jgi:hypothetical protein
MVAHLEVAASGSIVFESRIAGKVWREIGIGLGASSPRLVKSQAARSDPREFTSSPVSRNGERAGFPLEAEQEFYSGKDFLNRSAFRKQNVDVVAYVVQKRNLP